MRRGRQDGPKIQHLSGGAVRLDTHPSGRDTDSLTGIFFVQVGPLFEPADPGRSLGKRPEFGASNSGDNFVTNRLQIDNKLLHPEKLQNSYNSITKQMLQFDYIMITKERQKKT